MSVTEPPAGSERLAIVAALEALEVGDYHYATEVLLGALEDGPVSRTFACPICGLGFEWPGLVDRHVIVAHSFDELGADRAA